MLTTIVYKLCKHLYIALKIKDRKKNIQFPMCFDVKLICVYTHALEHTRAISPKYTIAEAYTNVIKLLNIQIQLSRMSTIHLSPSS